MLKREILQLETFGVTPRKWAPSSCRGTSNGKLKKERLSLQFECSVFTLQLTVQLLGSRKQGEKQGESTLAAAQSLPSGRQEERRAAHHLADHTAHQLQPWEPTAWLKYAPQTPLSRVVSEYIQVVDRNVVNGQLSSSLSRSIPMLIVVIQQLCFTPTSACCRFVKEPSAGPG